MCSIIRYVKQTIADLLMNRLDISLLIITKQISRAEDKCRPRPDPAFVHDHSALRAVAP